jgi:hypothetical protein
MHNVLHMDGFSFSANTNDNPVLTAVISIVGYVIVAFVYSRIFKKAGYAGWLAIIPIVNAIVIIKIAGHTPWSVLLYLIPIVDIVWIIIVMNHLAKSFGKGGAFGFFLLVWPFPFIGYLILAFGKSTYTNRRTVAE